MKVYNCEHYIRTNIKETPSVFLSQFEAASQSQGKGRAKKKKKKKWITEKEKKFTAQLLLYLTTVDLYKMYIRTVSLTQNNVNKLSKKDFKMSI